ncbi:NAD(P)H-binding protein [Chitinophaga agrisoli]|uniref:NAD(P)H-binding protein n=1 Tax=Chitinophaga agrisoli TaxID=2607653 RepID=A0A5B2VPU2_9BACT|nr:NmrA family NAD(P)-binding protein [Chitinophaga agrisoli]KAA2240698.1 NAD(P)H-binding protein [Chitinophaga agrisoli]
MDLKKKAAVLVTGATGQSGAMVIRELILQQVPVRALVRDREKARIWDGIPEVEIITGNMLQPDSLQPTLAGIERALLISSANDRMVDTQCSFIDACKAAGVPHVIKFSGEESQIGYNPQHFRFTREHNEIEGYLERSGLQWTHLRPSQFMQVYLREAAAIRTTGELRLPLEDIRMSPVDVRDIAKIAAALLAGGGYQSQRLRITGPEALSLAEIAAIIARIANYPVRYAAISIEERSQALLAAGLPPFFVEAVAAQTAERCKHPQARIDLNTHRLFNVTPTTFEQFVLHHAMDFGAPGDHYSNIK